MVNLLNVLLVLKWDGTHDEIDSGINCCVWLMINVPHSVRRNRRRRNAEVIAGMGVSGK